MKKQACALLTALVLLAAPALGQGWNIELVGTKYQAWQNAKFVACQGNYAYVGVNFSGPWNTALSVVDVTDSENPVEVAYCDLDVIYDIRVLEVSGDYAYVGFWNNQGWTIVDIANPLHPLVVCHSLTPHSVYDFQACDSLFYVLHSASSGSTGLMIFDISNPVLPAILGHYILPNQGTHIAVSGEYAYVSQSPGGLSVIDVSDPTLPFQVSSLAVPTSTYDVFSFGNYAYLTGSVGGMNTGIFYAVNVSNPQVPFLAGSLTVVDAGLRELEISGDLAVAGAYQEGFCIISIAQPANPALLAHWDSPPGSDILRDLAAGGDCVYAAYDYNGLAVINISNPQIPAYVCSYQPDWIILDVATEGNIAYLAAGNDGLLINDVSDPADPWQIAQLNEIGSAGAIQIFGNYAYVQTSPDSLKIVDVADPSNPQVAGSYNGRLYKFVDSLAYATADEGILKILDMSDPINPLEIGSYQQPGAYLFNLDTDGSFLYAMAAYTSDGSEEDSLLILDVNDPTNPQFLALCFSEDGDRHLVLGDGYLYAAGGLTGLIVYSVADPAHPIPVGHLAMQPSPSDILLSGDFVYMTFGGFNVGLKVVDVSDPTNPVLNGYYDTESFAHGVAVNGDYAYVADWDHFEIYDCSDAIHNDVNVTLTPLVQPIQIPASGGGFDYYLFAQNNGAGNQTLDLWTKVILPGGSVLSPIMGPVSVSLDSGTTGWIRHQNVPGRAAAGLYTYIACAGDYPNAIWASDSLQFTKLAFEDWGPGAGDWSNTGESFHFSDEPFITQHSSLIPSIRPNPFNPTTVLSFELRDPSFVKLRVFDISGRLVTMLVDGWREAGTHEVTFDGSELPSGIYVYRLQAGGSGASGKMVLLK